MITCADGNILELKYGYDQLFFELCLSSSRTTTLVRNLGVIFLIKARSLEHASLQPVAHAI